MWLWSTVTAEEKLRSEQESSDRASHEQLICQILFINKNIIVLHSCDQMKGEKIQSWISLIENQTSGSYCQKQFLGCVCREAAAGTLPVQQFKVISKNPSANCKVLGLKSNKVFGD